MVRNIHRALFRIAGAVLLLALVGCSGVRDRRRAQWCGGSERRRLVQMGLERAAEVGTQEALPVVNKRTWEAVLWRARASSSLPVIRQALTP